MVFCLLPAVNEKDGAGDCRSKIIGRGEMIRTSDLSVPNRAHYQAVLRPVILTRVSYKKHFQVPNSTGENINSQLKAA